ncbi:hypothetical protein [Roseimaritima ulvae]|nr:hypothetical protein [Roseimaritima ulvae]
MFAYGIRIACLLGLCLVSVDAVAQRPSAESGLPTKSEQPLLVPPVSQGLPRAGRRVAVTPPEYAATAVYHTIYLPQAWTADGEPLPIIFEYTGNRFPASGSTGEVKDAALGFGLSGGQYIWVALPYINPQGTANEVTWWGDQAATIGYAKTNVPRIIERYNANPQAVFLCGFSRGAIGVNYLGLHDDEIARLWTAFIAHDHFDGVRQWNTDWGSPLTLYRQTATQRLARVKGRPYWVSQNGDLAATESFVRSALEDVRSFRFDEVPVREILGDFPNQHALTGHTDRWPLLPSPNRDRIRNWMRQIVDASRKRIQE